jgi:NMD protein affecting ribosome stability and mRNA decay
MMLGKRANKEMMRCVRCSKIVPELMHGFCSECIKERKKRVN